MEQALDAASDLVRYEAKKLEDQQTSSSSSSGGGDDNNFDENNINLITSLVAILQEISKSGSFAKVVKNLKWVVKSRRRTISDETSLNNSFSKLYYIKLISQWN